MNLLPFIVERLPGASGYGALSIGFFVIIGGLALLVAFGAVLTIFKNLPLWVFRSWAHVTGILLGGYLYYLGYGWIAALAIFGAGLAVSAIWLTILDRQTASGQGVLGRINRRLLKRAMK